MAMQHVHCNARDPMHLEACILNQERRRDDPSRMVPEPERPSGSRDDPFAAPEASRAGGLWPNQQLSADVRGTNSFVCMSRAT